MTSEADEAVRTIAQLVIVEWNKAARGGREAQRRAAVPTSLQLHPGASTCREGGAAVHLAYFGSKNDFTCPVNQLFREYSLAKSVEAYGVRLSVCDGQLHVNYSWSPWECGAPKRIKFDGTGTEVPVRKEAFRLNSGEWGRLRHNGRFADVDTGDWYYRLVVANIAFCTSGTSDMFISLPPAKSHDELAELW